MIYVSLHTKYYLPKYNGLLIIAIKLEGKETFSLTNFLP
jgi:hypothetical protein